MHQLIQKSEYLKKIQITTALQYRKVYPFEVLQGFTNTAMFVLMLYEPLDNKKIPVMIGEHEAEMILLEQGQRQPLRPMTYQLISSIMDAFALTLKRVRIDRFEEGIFYATLVVSDGFSEKDIDSRASDAVVMALNKGVDIEMDEEVIKVAGFTPQDETISMEESLSNGSTIEELEEELRQCEENEDYERAAEIMELIKKINDEQDELPN